MRYLLIILIFLELTQNSQAIFETDKDWCAFYLGHVDNTEEARDRQKYRYQKNYITYEEMKYKEDFWQRKLDQWVWRYKEKNCNQYDLWRKVY